MVLLCMDGRGGITSYKNSKYHIEMQDLFGKLMILISFELANYGRPYRAAIRKLFRSCLVNLALQSLQNRSA
jgi:hypothetical protein